MIDLTVATSSGNVLGTSTSATIVSPFRLDQSKEIKKLKQEIKSLSDLNDHLRNEINKLNNTKTEAGFTKEELAFILSKVHPDKNPHSNLALELTKKLLSKRRK